MYRVEQFEETSFGEVLQRFRKRARLTQAALAQRLGSHRSTISFWERGEYVPETLTTVLELARVLNLSDADTRLLVEARFGTASLLPFHNLPDPNPYFTGRETLLEMLHRALTSGEQVALVQTQAISGLGGIGKTQLALAYAYRCRQHYHDILWALAESHETLTTSYMTLAQHLRLDLRAEYEQQKVVEAVKRWLREHKGWLLILDNIEDLGLVRAFVPTPRQGALLLTTRREETSPVARALALDVLPEEEGILFLLRRSGQLAMEATLAAATPHQRAAAQAIVEALGGLPLALDQAGAYLAETRCSLTDYLVLFQQERQALLHRRGTVPSEHPESVTTTFSLAFAQVQQQSEAASDLLKLCAYLAPEALPLDLLSQGASTLGPVLAPVAAQGLAFNAALETLQTYSLVRRNAEQSTLSLHRLVQAVQQEALSEEEQRGFAERAVHLVSAAFPTPDAVNWERCQQLMPHVLVCAEHIERWDFASSEAASLLHQAGRYLHRRAAYVQGLPLLQRALALREQILGPDHPDVAQTLDALALLSQSQGQYTEALPLFQRSLAIREQTLGQDHPDVAVALNNLAHLYRYQGRYVEAQPLAEQALAINEQALGPTHPEVATSLNTLALLHRAQGHYTEALPLYQRALAIREQVLGPDHPDLAVSLGNLALFYRSLGRSAEALPLIQQTLAINERVLGPNHTDVALTLNNLALFYYDQKRYEEAVPLIQRALAIYEQALGPDHPDVAWSLNNLANFYRLLGRSVEALPLIQRALAIREQALGPDHPSVAISLHILAQLYYDQGQYKDALPLFKRARTIREQALGPDHPDVAQSLNALAELYEVQEQYEQALPLYQRALTILKQAIPNHPDTTTAHERLAALLQRMGHVEEASTLIARNQANHARTKPSPSPG
jgi:tetratricopeptide (TPR) repeat protein/DNA-binding XRE family transcriptional regulator